MFKTFSTQYKHNYHLCFYVVISFSILGINRMGLSVLLAPVRRWKDLVTFAVVRPGTNDSTRNYPDEGLTSSLGAYNSLRRELFEK